MSVCPTGATYKKPNGIVMVRQDLCVGCRACAMACPYHARVEVTYADVAMGREFYGSDYRRTSPSVDKCTLCDHRVEQGLKPACVETCVGSARMFGDLDDPEDPVAQMVASGVARPLMPHNCGRGVYPVRPRRRVVAADVRRHRDPCVGSNWQSSVRLGADRRRSWARRSY